VYNGGHSHFPLSRQIPLKINKYNPFTYDSNRSGRLLLSNKLSLDLRKLTLHIESYFFESCLYNHIENQFF
jgi:hypothetical protein